MQLAGRVGDVTNHDECSLSRIGLMNIESSLNIK